MSKKLHNSQSKIHNSQIKYPNVDWAAAFVAELVAAGLTAVCIAPGSRSTPLVLAFHAQPGVEIYRHLDERSAGFFALGMAIAGDKPVALVCTSGTAVANFFPAVIEAKMSQIPLLVLTADRPPELRHSGANQTIDQVKIFGDLVLWSVDAALPEADPPAAAWRNLQTLAARAYARANGLQKGPIHINFPFRKPLQPEAPFVPEKVVARPGERAVTTISIGRMMPSPDQLATIEGLLQNLQRGLIICGPRCPGGHFPAEVARLAAHLGFPILADGLSGVRFGQAADLAAAFGKNLVISSYDTFLQQDPGWPEPEVILRFGALPVSRWLNDYLDRIETPWRLHIRENGVWADDSHRISNFFQANETAVCRALCENLPAQPDEEWVTAVCQRENMTWRRLEEVLYDPYFDGAVVADILTNIPTAATLFLENSLPVRHLDQYGRGRGKSLFSYASRGASGIDGNISTGLGIHAVRQQSLVAVVGDITFYHDMNGLYALWRTLVADDGSRQNDLEAGLSETVPAFPGNITIVLINNNGGGIFNRLPVSQFDPPFSQFFLTPHGLDFEPAAQMYGLEYVRVHGREDFLLHLRTSVTNEAPNLIEIVTDNQTDENRRKEINKIVNH